MELFKLIGKIAIENDEAKKALVEVIDEGNDAEIKLSKLGAGAAKVGKALVAGLAVGATAVSGITAAAVNAFAEFEQLEGGAKLMFGEGFDYIAQQAKNAFSTVQMSQNEYLQQANGFAVGLKTALGGNEQAAAELSHKIIQAEADIIAATGNTQENVQNAFHGIMKSNYTMLDNLGLGITPTKEGFQQVINKVNEWNKANGHATKYQISNLADCQAALVDYIEMQGMSGYAAAEASGTIQGSLAMTKSAWENLMVGLASGNADIPQLVSDVVSSGSLVVENIIPKIKNVLLSLPQAISQISPEAGAAFQKIFDGVMAILPSLKDALSTTFNLVADTIGFMTEHQGLMIGIASVIGTVVAAITTYNTVQAIKSALDLSGSVSLGTLTAAMWANVTATAAALAPYLAVAAAVAAVIAIGVLLYKNWDEIKAKCIELAQNLKQKFTEIKTAVVEKVTELKDKAVQKFVEIKDNVVNKVNELKEKATQKFNDVKTSIVNVCKNVVDWVKNNWTSLLTFFINPFAGLFDYFYRNNSKFREFVDNAINEIKQLPSKAWTWLQNTISKVASFVSDLANKGRQAATNLLNNIVNGLKSLPSKMASVGKNVVQGIWTGITNAKDWLLKKIKGFAKTITKGIKDFFGIKSPSRVMRDEVGKMLAEGVALGITENTATVENATEDMGQTILDAAQKKLDNYTVYNSLTLADEIAFWDVVRQKITEGTDARISADQKYLESKKKFNDELLTAEEILQKSLDDIAKKIEDRAKSIMSSFKMFDGVEDEYSIQDLLNGKHKTDLVTDLQTQVAELEDWERQTERLAEKIGGSTLYEEIYSLGFDALPQIRLLNSLTADELEKYVEIYNKKSEIAYRIANAELKDESFATAQAAYQTFADKCGELGADISTSTGWAETAFKNLKTTVGTEMESAFKVVVHALSKMNEAFANFAPRINMPKLSFSMSNMGIKWHADAVNSPRILDSATIFGYSSKSGKLLGGGEAGSEMIGGTNTVMTMIKNAVATENAELINVLTKILKAILSMDKNMGDNLREALTDTSLSINNREFARLVKAVN